MFFIFGISSKEEKLDFSQTMICKTCGAYGRLEAFMTYSYFSLFFIKIFKWNKKYYIRSTCCDSLYSIEEDLGKAIKKGEGVTIKDSDLKLINSSYKRVKTCENCSYPVEKDFDFCPKCGHKL